MCLCVICALRKLYRTHQINVEHPPPEAASVASNITSELGGLHTFSFNSILVLLAVLTISGSKVCLPVVLALLIYTISLRLALNPCFIQSHPTVSIFLHVVPLLGTLCMACVELVLGMKSLALAVVILLFSVLPFVTTILHHGRQCGEIPLPVPAGMQNAEHIIHESGRPGTTS